MGMVNPGSSVSSLSQTTLTVTVAGPVIPSLSRGEVRTRLAVPSLVSILMGLFSVSVRDKVMSLPTSPEIGLGNVFDNSWELFCHAVVLCCHMSLRHGKQLLFSCLGLVWCGKVLGIPWDNPGNFYFQ